MLAVQVISYIDRERRVTTTVEDSFPAIDEHCGFVVDSPEVEKYAPIRPLLRDLECSSIP